MRQVQGAAMVLVDVVVVEKEERWHATSSRQPSDESREAAIHLVGAHSRFEPPLACEGLSLLPIYFPPTLMIVLTPSDDTNMQSAKCG